jgi:hypothetical protein
MGRRQPDGALAESGGSAERGGAGGEWWGAWESAAGQRRATPARLSAVPIAMPTAVQAIGPSTDTTR